MNSTGKPEFPSRRNFLLASAGLALAPAPALTQSLGRQEQPDIDLVFARRRQYLKEIKELVPPTLTRVMESKKLGDRINAYDKTWEDWVDRVGELPPDFESMPSIPHLPDPLLLDEDGRETPITTKMQWERKRDWIRSQYEHWVIGRMPPKPENLCARVIRTTWEGKVKVEKVRLQFGPNHACYLNLDLWLFGHSSG